jgi:twitching motility protein PilT
VDGHLEPMTDQKRLLAEDTIAIAFSVMNARQKQKFKDAFELDMAYSVPGLGRFRCSVFQQRGTVGLVLRVIPVKIHTIKDLLLPPALETIAD